MEECLGKGTSSQTGDPWHVNTKGFKGVGKGRGGGGRGHLGTSTQKAPRKGGQGEGGKGVEGSQIPWHVNTEGSISVAIKLRAKGQARV